MSSSIALCALAAWVLNPPSLPDAARISLRPYCRLLMTYPIRTLTLTAPILYLKLSLSIFCARQSQRLLGESTPRRSLPPGAHVLEDDAHARLLEGGREVPPQEDAVQHVPPPGDIYSVFIIIYIVYIIIVVYPVYNNINNYKYVQYTIL